MMLYAAARSSSPFPHRGRKWQSVRTLTFDNYYVNGAKVEGTTVVTNTGLNNNSNVVFSVVLTGGKITFSDGKFIEREFETSEGIYGRLSDLVDSMG